MEVSNLYGSTSNHRHFRIGIDFPFYTPFISWIFRCRTWDFHSIPTISWIFHCRPWIFHSKPSISWIFHQNLSIFGKLTATSTLFIRRPAPCHVRTPWRSPRGYRHGPWLDSGRPAFAYLVIDFRLKPRGFIVVYFLEKYHMIEYRLCIA